MSISLKVTCRRFLVFAIGLLWLSRIPIVLASAMVVLAAFRLSGAWPSIAVVGSLVAMLMGGYAFNDVADRAADALAAPYRPIPSGKVSVRGALLLISILWLVSLVCLVFASSLPLSAYVVSYAVSFILYSRFWRAHWVSKNFSTAIWFGSLGMVPCVVGLPWSHLLVEFSCAVGVFTLGRELLMDVRDLAEQAALPGISRPECTLGIAGGVVLVPLSLVWVWMLLTPIRMLALGTLLVAGAVALSVLKPSDLRRKLWFWAEWMKTSLLILLMGVVLPVCM